MYCIYKYITHNLYVRHIKLLNYIYNLFTNTHTHIYKYAFTNMEIQDFTLTTIQQYNFSHLKVYQSYLFTMSV